MKWVLIWIALSGSQTGLQTGEVWFNSEVTCEGALTHFTKLAQTPLEKSPSESPHLTFA